MNSCSLSSPTRTWWLPSAAAGAAAIAAITVVVAVPAANAVRIEGTPDEAPATYVLTVRDEPTAPRPCFMFHARWNVALDGPQPTC